MNVEQVVAPSGFSVLRNLATGYQAAVYLPFVLSDAVVVEGAVTSPVCRGDIGTSTVLIEATLHAPNVPLRGSGEGDDLDLPAVATTTHLYGCPVSWWSKVHTNSKTGDVVLVSSPMGCAASVDELLRFVDRRPVVARVSDGLLSACRAWTCTCTVQFAPPIRRGERSITVLGCGIEGCAGIASGQGLEARGADLACDRIDHRAGMRAESTVNYDNFRWSTGPLVRVVLPEGGTVGPFDDDETGFHIDGPVLTELSAGTAGDFVRHRANMVRLKEAIELPEPYRVSFKNVRDGVVTISAMKQPRSRTAEAGGGHGGGSAKGPDTGDGKTSSSFLGGRSAKDSVEGGSEPGPAKRSDDDAAEVGEDYGGDSTTGTVMGGGKGPSRLLSNGSKDSIEGGVEASAAGSDPGLDKGSNPKAAEAAVPGPSAATKSSRQTGKRKASSSSRGGGKSTRSTRSS
eukprot:g6611.t1